jgi:hypothetical protein
MGSVSQDVLNCQEKMKCERRLRTMARIEELTNEVQQLSREELAAFRDWFRRYDSDEWDKEIEEDILAGRLEGLADKAIADHKAGRTKEF